MSDTEPDPDEKILNNKFSRVYLIEELERIGAKVVASSENPDILNVDGVIVIQNIGFPVVIDETGKNRILLTKWPCQVSITGFKSFNIIFASGS